MTTRPRPRLCRYCRTDPFSQSLQACVESLAHCTNCLADIAMRGGWTGHGSATLFRLCGMYSQASVRDAWERHRLGHERPRSAPADPAAPDPPLSPSAEPEKGA